MLGFWIHPVWEILYPPLNYIRLNSHLRFFRRELLHALFSPPNRKKWVHNHYWTFQSNSWPNCRCECPPYYSVISSGSSNSWENRRCECTIRHWWTKGVAGTCAPSFWSNFFHFHAVSGKNWPNNKVGTPTSELAPLVNSRATVKEL